VTEDPARAGYGGEPLVLLHGGSARARVWAPELAALAAAGFDAVAPELCSGAHSANLFALLRGDLGFERVTVAAVGLGAALACDFALRFPGYVQLLALADLPDLAAALVVPTETILLRSARAARAFPNRLGPLAVAGDAHEALCRAVRHLCRAPRTRAGDQVAYVALGSNLGDRERHLCAGFAALRALRGVRDVVASRVYETDPVGPGDQRPYLNAVARLRTQLAPRTLLEHLLAIERSEGRERGAVRNAPRTLDLDLLLHGECEQSEPGLVVPHPRIAQRPFVLEPLCDLAPDLVLPGARVPVHALAAAVRDPAAVRVRVA
jgi:2-amino-4-hydroxy-6-hydroxymethyldihydropteridine diphosphokinase